jgi:hypothetical protein
MPFLYFPLALIALAGIPVLAGIYLLRSRFRRQPVSSLMLWTDHRQPREGGRRVQQLKTPLLFFLELIAILFLIAAAVQPMVRWKKAGRSLIIVLDDSYSMQADPEHSARTQAVQALKNELEQSVNYSARFILAGSLPQLLGDTIHDISDIKKVLSHWQCLSPEADLPAAVNLAHELAGNRSHILVLTDQPPIETYGKGKIQWWSFGQNRANVAIVNAARTWVDAKQRCLLEVQNFSERSISTNLIVNFDSLASETTYPLTLAQGQREQLVFEVPANVKMVRVRLSPDMLAIDNEVLLLPERNDPIRVTVDMQDEPLYQLVTRALIATDQVLLAGKDAELYFTDRVNSVNLSQDTWLVQLIQEADTSSYIGPFVMDQSHPLTEGLWLEGVIWSAGTTDDVPGRPILMAGNIPLLTDAASLTGRHHLRWRLKPELSTLTESNAWPVLIWNLLQWRRSQMPGLQQVNLRLGAKAIFRSESGITQMEVKEPDGKIHSMDIFEETAIIPAREIGLYEIRSEKGNHSFAVNALSREESDLRATVRGRWGDWRDESTLRREYQNLGWIFLLVTLGLLAAHHLVLYRQSQSGQEGIEDETV